MKSESFIHDWKYMLMRTLNKQGIELNHAKPDQKEATVIITRYNEILELLVNPTEEGLAEAHRRLIKKL